MDRCRPRPSHTMSPVMAGRRTNLALAVLLAIALATGVVAFAIGTGWVRPVLVAHGLAAVAIVLMVPWKSAIVRRGLGRKRDGGTLSTLLAVLVVTALVSGVAHSVFNVDSVGPLAIMQIHVGAAAGALVLGLAHVWQRPQRIRVSDLSRRNFLRSGALAAGAVLGYLAVEATARAAGLPGATRRATGSHERGSFDPRAMPVTSWLDDTPPRPRHVAHGEDGYWCDRVLHRRAGNPCGSHHSDPGLHRGLVRHPGLVRGPPGSPHRYRRRQRADHLGHRL